MINSCSAATYEMCHKWAKLAFPRLKHLCMEDMLPFDIFHIVLQYEALRFEVKVGQ